MNPDLDASIKNIDFMQVNEIRYSAFIQTTKKSKNSSIVRDFEEYFYFAVSMS